MPSQHRARLQHKCSSTNLLDEPANILVLELRDTITPRRLASRTHCGGILGKQAWSKKNISGLGKEGLTDTVVGLLGARLEADLDFVSLHIAPQLLPQESRRSIR